MDSMVLVEIANRYIVDFVPRPLYADQYSRQIEAGFRSSSQTVHTAPFIQSSTTWPIKHF